MSELISNLLFVWQRFTWASLLDILLVAAFFAIFLYLLRDTEGQTLMRGVLVVVIVITLLTSMVNLPAFSWLVATLTPVLILSIPVIFAPEIRRGLGRMGKLGDLNIFGRKRSQRATEQLEKTIKAIADATVQLSERKHGALIVVRRKQYLDQYYKNGVMLDAEVTPQMLLQIFYPNTPLHDGAVIIEDNRIKAASCVMPLSSSGVLYVSVERSLGLRHRAALGISEVSDAIAVVVSEETGTISIAQQGRLIRRLDGERLRNSLHAFLTLQTKEIEAPIERGFLNYFRKAKSKEED
jgi:diadenylate cyclase